jgi:hypothetical protein
MTLHPEQEPAGFTLNSSGGEVVTSYGIGKWLLEGKETGATHLIVVCDTFDHDDYPVYVMPDEDVREVEARYNGQSMQRVMEVYWLDGDLNAQLDKRRSFTYGPDNS